MSIWTRRLLRTGLLVLILLAGAAGISALASRAWPLCARMVEPDALATHVTEPKLDDIPRMTGVAFPAGTELVGARHVWAGQYWSLLCAVRFPHSELNALKDSLPVTEPWSAENRFGLADTMRLLVAAPEWWRPDSAEEFIAGESSNDVYREYGYVSALIGLDDETQITVYFFQTR